MRGVQGRRAHTCVRDAGILSSGRSDSPSHTYHCQQESGHGKQAGRALVRLAKSLEALATAPPETDAVINDEEALYVL